MAEIYRSISRDGSVVATVIQARDIVAEIERFHKTSAVVTAALGRLSIAASLIGTGLKCDDGSVTLRIDADGPAGCLIAVSDSYGNVKAYVQNPIVEIPLNSVSKLDVRGAVGTNGTLSVIKDLRLKEPYVGQIALVSGEIAEDIASYFASSEQIPTVCALGVLVNPDLTVKEAGGYIIQLLPFTGDNVIDKLEANVKTLKPITEMLSDGMSAEEIALRVLEGLEPNILDNWDVAYKCDCSRERTERMLRSIGAEELIQMADEQETTEVCCNFCDKKYTFTADELRKMINK